LAEFLDGPAKGISLNLRTCPRYLRVVIDHEEDGVDALDQRGDSPKDNEDVYVYLLQEDTWGVVFVRPGGRYEHGKYTYHPVDFAQAVSIRDLDGWIDYLVENFKIPDPRKEGFGGGT